MDEGVVDKRRGQVTFRELWIARRLGSLPSLSIKFILTIRNNPVIWRVRFSKLKLLLSIDGRVMKPEPKSFIDIVKEGVTWT